MMSSEKESTNTRILKSARELLEADNGNGVRMSDIAKASGVSRQAVYLHFPSRAELLIATTRYVDQVNEIDKSLAASRAATDGIQRLDAYIDAWGNYIPKIYGAAKALLAMKDTDREADAAWADRMQAHREGCKAAIDALARDGKLTATYTRSQSVDWLWTLLSVRNWEQFTKECGWSQIAYVKTMKHTAESVLIR